MSAIEHRKIQNKVIKVKDQLAKDDTRNRFSLGLFRNAHQLSPKEGNPKSPTTEVNPEAKPEASVRESHARSWTRVQVESSPPGSPRAPRSNEATPSTSQLKTPAPTPTTIKSDSDEKSPQQDTTAPQSEQPHHSPLTPRSSLASREIFAPAVVTAVTNPHPRPLSETTYVDLDFVLKEEKKKEREERKRKLREERENMERKRKEDEEKKKKEEEEKQRKLEEDKIRMELERKRQIEEEQVSNSISVFLAHFNNIFSN